MPPNPLYYGGQVADLLRDRGRIEAQRASTKGATLASAFQAAPRALAGFVQTRDARRAAAQAEAERGEDRQWQGQQRQRTMAEWGREDAITDAARKVPLGPDGQPDYSRIAGEVARIDPMAAAPYRQLAEADITRAKRVAQEKAEVIAKELSGTKDQATWDTALNRLAKKDIHGVPRVFDASTRDASVAEALTFGQWLQTQEPEPLIQRDPTRNLEGSRTGKIVRPGVPAQKIPTDKEQGYRDYAVSIKKPYETLTFADKRKADAAIAAATRAPEKASANEKITPAMKATAVRWKFDQNKALADAVAASAMGTDAIAGLSPDAQALLMVMRPGGAKARPFTAAEIARRERDIENTYRASIGEAALPPEPALHVERPPAGFRPVAEGGVAPAAPLGQAPATAAPTSQRPTAPITAPSTPTVQRPTPSASTTRPNMGSSIPPDVSALLATGAAGRYTMTDGSVWEKAADGTIQRVQ